MGTTMGRLGALGPLSRWLAFLLMVTSRAGACVFDCHFNEATPSGDPTVCRGAPVRIDEVPLSEERKARVRSAVMLTDGIFNLVIHPTILSVNLSTRNITAIATNGLECFDFIPYMQLVGDQWFNGAGGLQLGGVNLDGNGTLENCCSFSLRL